MDYSTDTAEVLPLFWTIISIDFLYIYGETDQKIQKTATTSSFGINVTLIVS